MLISDKLKAVRLHVSTDFTARPEWHINFDILIEFKRVSGRT
jgi:hypothetical protein